LVTGRLKQVWSWEKTVVPPPIIGYVPFGRQISSAATVAFARAAVGKILELRATTGINNARNSAYLRFHFPLA